MARFPEDVIAAAQASMRKWGVPASVTLAQWAVESAYGAHMPAGSNNPFGIKAAQGQPSVTVPTREVINGRSVQMQAAFRRFASIAEAFDVHGQLLGTSHYYAHAMTLRTNPDAFANALTGVYATDPHYGATLIQVMKSNDLYQFDKPAAPAVPSAPKETPKMATASQPAPAPKPAPTAAPKPAPTVLQGIEADWGSWASQALKHATHIVEAAAEGGEQLAIKAIPFGSIIDMFIGPTVVKQYVDLALTMVEGWLDQQKFTADDATTLKGAVLKLMNTGEPDLVVSLETKLEPMIEDALASVGITVGP